MEEKTASRLAVARLEEVTPAHRYREEEPVHGFCLISGDEAHCRVTLYIENGRALTDRSGRAGFYYEGWLVGPDGPVSLGAFNLGPGGQGAATRTLEGAALPAGRSELVRVTAEPFGSGESGAVTVLEGRLISLATGAASPGQPLLTGELAQRAEAVREEGTAVLAAVPSGAGDQAPTGSVAMSDTPSGMAAPPAEALAPPAEPRPANLLEQNLRLLPRHPMAPRAGGTATVRIRQGVLILTLRGLPSPTALGRDTFTDRPFNAYRVWLVNQQTGIRTPAGFCQRAWGENFRFEADSLPLARHDSVLVTVEDRTAPAGNTACPQVLACTYAP